MLLIGFALKAQYTNPHDVHLAKFRWMELQQLDSLSAFLHPDLKYIHSNGWIESKDDVLKDLQSGKLVYLKVQVQEAQVRQIAQTAIVTGKGNFKVVMDGKSLDINLLYTEVYVKQKKQWLLISRHANRL
jgi:hypothetical protein